MKYSTFMMSRDVDLQGTVHDINANIYDSMLQKKKKSVDINKLCKVSTRRQVEKSNTLRIATCNIHNTG